MDASAWRVWHLETSTTLRIRYTMWPS